MHGMTTEHGDSGETANNMASIAEWNEFVDTTFSALKAFEEERGVAGDDGAASGSTGGGPMDVEGTAALPSGSPTHLG